MKKLILIVFSLVVVFLGMYIFFFYQTPAQIADQNNNGIINSVVFNCAESKSIQAVFFKDRVELTLNDGRNMLLSQAISASGARYANADESFVFWNKGDTAFINEGNKTTFKECVITPSATENWKTYKNEEAGYAFKYPTEWNAVTNKYNSKNSLFGPGATNESGYGGVEFYGTLSAGQSLKDFIKKFNSGVEGGSTSESETTINGQTVVISILPKASIEPTEVKSVSFEKGGKVFNVYLMYKTNFDQYPEDEQRLNIFNQMLLTFSFL